MHIDGIVCVRRYRLDLMALRFDKSYIPYIYMYIILTTVCKVMFTFSQGFLILYENRSYGLYSIHCFYTWTRNLRTHQLRFINHKSNVISQFRKYSFYDAVAKYKYFDRLVIYIYSVYICLKRNILSYDFRINKIL